MSNHKNIAAMHSIDSVFSVIFEQSPISTQIFSPDGYSLNANKAWEKLWGVRHDQILGYNVLKDNQLVEKGIMKYIKKGFKGEVTEVPAIKYVPSQTLNISDFVEYRWVKALTYPVKNEKGEIVHVILQHEDITLQKKAEEDLKVSEEKFRTLIEKSTDAIQLVSPEGKILYTSDSIKNVLGYTAEELQGQGVAPFMHPDDMQYFNQKVQELLTKPNGQVTLQYRVKHKDGTWAWLETTGVNHLNTPNIHALVGTFRNITKRKLHDEELRYQKTLLEAQREVSPEGILVVSPEGKMVSYNKRFVGMWNFSKTLMNKGQDELALQKATQQLVDPEEFMNKVAHIYKNHKASFDTLYFKDGRVFDRYGSPLIGEDRTDYGYVWFFQDVTERRRLERQKDDFIGIASHELKTPVTSIKAYGQVLKTIFERKGDTYAASQLTKMDVQISKLTNLIGDLLDVTKINSGRLEFHEEYFDFNDLVKEIVEEMQRTTDKHHIIKKLTKSKRVFADRERIGQVLINLISNAIKYSPHSKEIIVTTSFTNKDITLCVKDFGVGIPEDKKEKIFEQFFRVSGPKQNTFPGLGLGLYVSSEIIKREGGKIWVEAPDSKKAANRNGSTFCFRLPLKRTKTKITKKHVANQEIKQE